MGKLDLFSLKPSPTTLENGNTVYLRRMTAADRLAWFERIDSRSKDDAAASFATNLEDSAWLLAIALCDESGNRIFADGELGEIKQIDGLTLNRLADEIITLNGMGAKSKEDAEKKPETTATTTDSSANSPAPLA
jgi:hypothetical protein